MKQLLLLTIILAALSTSAQSATVSAYATDVLRTDGSFSQTPGGTALSDNEIQQILVNNTINTIIPIYGDSPNDYSIIDLGFGDNTVVTGSGADLIVYSLWYGYEYSFGLEVFNQAFDLNSTPTPLSSYSYTVNNSRSTFSNDCVDDGNDGCAYIASTLINLYNNDLSTGTTWDDRELVDGIELSYISLFIGGSLYDGDTAGGSDAYSNFFLVGDYHSDAAAVPLPLSAVLFSSGLALLGWTGRRRTI